MKRYLHTIPYPTLPYRMPPSHDTYNETAISNKLRRECKSGSYVLSYRFPLPLAPLLGRVVPSPNPLVAGTDTDARLDILAKRRRGQGQGQGQLVEDALSLVRAELLRVDEEMHIYRVL